MTSNETDQRGARREGRGEIPRDQRIEAVPESTVHQSQKELEQLNAKLQEELARLQEGFFGGSEQDIAGELSSIDQHPADSATITESREIGLTLGQLLGARREDVLRALEKIKNGTYGLCEYGGEAIDPERLKVHPEAVYCLEHQRLIEQERRGEQRRRLGEETERY